MEKIGILQGHKTPKKGQQGVHGGFKHSRPSSGVSYLVVKLQNTYHQHVIKLHFFVV